MSVRSQTSSFGGVTGHVPASVMATTGLQLPDPGCTPASLAIDPARHAVTAQRSSPRGRIALEGCHSAARGTTPGASLALVCAAFVAAIALGNRAPSFESLDRR